MFISRISSVELDDPKAVPMPRTPMTISEAVHRAVCIGSLGSGTVSPNPLVGCVILDRENRFLAEGYHRRIGGDHAEIDAIKNFQDQFAHSDFSDCTFVVTLEPCAHQGRTPSCAQTIANLEKPPAKLVFGLIDPNPKVAGEGQIILRNAGIECYSLAEFLQKKQDLSLIRAERACAELAEIFLFNQRQKVLPWISLKLAQTLDGQIAHVSGESKWITSSESRSIVQKIRRDHDAILIGRKTAELDNPSLDPRVGDGEFVESKTFNRVVVLDPSARLHGFWGTSKILKVRPPENVYWIVQRGNRTNVSATPSGLNLIELSDMNPVHISKVLRESGLASVMVEGGAVTAASFLKERLVQRLHLFTASKILGSDRGLSWTHNLALTSLGDAIKFENPIWRQFADDHYFSGLLHDRRR